jgi:hypothetical protein
MDMISWKLIAHVTVFVVVTAAKADVSVGDIAPDFALNTVDGHEFSTQTPRDRQLIVFFSAPGLGHTPWGWRDSLRVLYADSSFEYARVGDFGDWSWFLRPIIRRELKNENDTQSLLDWNGEVSEAWRGKDRSKLALVVVTPKNRVIAIARGYANAENVRAVISAIRSIRE